MVAATLRDCGQSTPQLRRLSLEAMERSVDVLKGGTEELVKIVFCNITPLSGAQNLPSDFWLACFVLHAVRCNYQLYGSKLLKLFMGAQGAARGDFGNVARVTSTGRLLLNSDERG